MTELGSDERFAGLGDTSRLGQGVRAERVRARLEEWRVSAAELADDPGVDYPDPDRAPPAGEPHPEFDPLPGV
jgi:hypothetical protein